MSDSMRVRNVHSCDAAPSKRVQQTGCGRAPSNFGRMRVWDEPLLSYKTSINTKLGTRNDA